MRLDAAGPEWLLRFPMAQTCYPLPRPVQYTSGSIGATGLRVCYQLSHGRRWEPILLSSRNEERRVWSIFERRVTTKWGKLTPALQVAVQIRGPRRQGFVAGVEFGPYFVVILDCGPATVFGLRLVWPDFRPQRRPRES